MAYHILSAFKNGNIETQATGSHTSSRNNPGTRRK